MFSFYIARRYLLSKKSHAAINIISWVSVLGVAIATAALVCILSVFNGFEDMVADLFTQFDPQLKVVPATAKYMDADSEGLHKVKEMEQVAIYTEVMQDNALITANNRQLMGIIKGVDDNFCQLTDLDESLVGDGIFELHVDVINYAVPGIGVLQQLALPADFHDPIVVYAPCQGERIDIMNPEESFNCDNLFSPGVCFAVKQSKYDAHYILVAKEFAQRLFDQEGKISAVELRLKGGTSISATKAEIQKLLGEGYKVLDRYEQQEDTFKIMQIEKLISYIFLTFILMVACFNIIGSLSMLIIDKKDDAMTLRNLGVSDKQLSQIFMIEGRMIATLGAIIGIAIGLTLCLIQQHYGLIRFGDGDGQYIISAYPVSVHGSDIVLIFVTVLVVGFASVWYPVKSLTKKFTNNTNNNNYKT